MGVNGRMTDWDLMTPHEKIMTFPDRHPYTFKAVLYLVVFVCSVPWTAVDALMRQMGFVRIDVQRVSEDGSTVLSAPTYTSPEQSSNSLEVL